VLKRPEGYSEVWGIAAALDSTFDVMSSMPEATDEGHVTDHGLMSM
jgi:hypothetical protein